MDMHSNGDDKLLIPDIFEDENLENGNKAISNHSCQS